MIPISPQESRMLDDSSADTLESRYRRLQQSDVDSDVFEYLLQNDANSLDDQIRVLLIDQTDSWRAGDGRKIDEYLNRIPDLRSRPDLLFQLIHGEIQLQHAVGGKISFSDYIERYPEFESQILSLKETTIARLSQSTPSHAPSDVFPIDDRQLSEIDLNAEVDISADTTPFPTEFPAVRVGRYELRSEIAHGGMGVVYEAYDTDLDRIVALKLIKSGEFASTDEMKRFQTEAKSAARLQHPGVVQIYEIGQDARQSFLAMAYVDGPNLWQLVKDRPMSPQQAARIRGDGTWV